MTIECLGNWENCLMQIPDGMVDESFIWKIGCIKRNECYLEWVRMGKQIKDIKLLEE